MARMGTIMLCNGISRLAQVHMQLRDVEHPRTLVIAACSTSSMAANLLIEVTTKRTSGAAWPDGNSRTACESQWISACALLRSRSGHCRNL